MTAQSRTETSRAVEVGEATAALEQTPAPAQAPHGTDAASSTASGAGAGLLRQAAVLMRERAELAPDGPWLAGERCVWGALPGHEVVSDGPDGKGGASTSQGAEHIASWHPPVALAVADWLESVHANLSTYNATRANHAFAVARAYLGGDR